jgi:hypothetical protein
MELNCNICNRKLDEPGALVFSPPSLDKDLMLVNKYHICVICWPLIREKLNYESIN